MDKLPPVYIVDGMRSPFLKARGIPGPFSATSLAVQTGKGLLLRQPFLPSALSEVIIGCAAPAPDEVNIGRIIALRLQCGHHVPGWTVMRNCASGLQAIDSAVVNIQSGRSDLVLAGGVDALSRAPVLFSESMVRWLSQWYAAKGLAAKSRQLMQWRPHYLKPVIGLLKGLTDPVVGLSMGQTAENLAFQWNIARAEMDRFAVQSHQRALDAQKDLAQEIQPLFNTTTGDFMDTDDGIRSDSSIARLATLKPAFDKRYGNITAGNSAQITDGAALLLLASEQALERWQLTPLGKIVDIQWSGLSPERMGLGPVHASTPLLQRHHLALNDLDVWEINEAFAAQVLACLETWQDAAYCREHLQLPAALGRLDETRLNLKGGAIAIGHPVGASGARIVLTLLHSLRDIAARTQKAKPQGIATLCIGGGMGGAILLEGCSESLPNNSLSSPLKTSA